MVQAECSADLKSTLSVFTSAVLCCAQVACGRECAVCVAVAAPPLTPPPRPRLLATLTVHKLETAISSRTALACGPSHIADQTACLRCLRWWPTAFFPTHGAKRRRRFDWLAFSRVHALSLSLSRSLSGFLLPQSRVYDSQGRLMEIIFFIFFLFEKLPTQAYRAQKLDVHSFSSRRQLMRHCAARQLPVHRECCKGKVWGEP